LKIKTAKKGVYIPIIENMHQPVLTELKTLGISIIENKAFPELKYPVNKT
jgi:hypothetical protein